MKLFVGIDPGMSGAIVALSSDGAYHAHALMPTMKKGAANRVNGAELAFVLQDLMLVGDVSVTVESVHSMPGQGVSSSFSFGHSLGVIEGVVAALRLPYQMVTPQSWKKQFGLLGTDKDAARVLAIRQFPSIRELSLKGKGQAIADALFIAKAGIK